MRQFAACSQCSVLLAMAELELELASIQMNEDDVVDVERSHMAYFICCWLMNVLYS
jgi:hypothetical protein